MNHDSVKLGVALFGYRKSTVEQLLADRDTMLETAHARLRHTEERIAELERQLTLLQAQGASEEHAGVTAAPPPEPGEVEEAPPAPAAETEAPAASEEAAPAPAAETEGPAAEEEPLVEEMRNLSRQLSAILTTARNTADRLLQEGRARNEEQLREVRRLWERLREDVDRVEAWRNSVQPIISAVRTSAMTVRGVIEEVPVRIEETLSPLAEAITAIQEDMDGLAEAWAPPPLVEPDEPVLDLEADPPSDQRAHGTEPTDGLAARGGNGMSNSASYSAVTGIGL